MGKREIGELDINELVSTLLISEIAAIPIDDPDIPLLNAIIPILLILSLEIIISFAKNKSNTLKRYVEGEPCFIIYDGRVLQKAFLDNRISINEFLAEMRTRGIGDIRDVKYALLEHNGKISILDGKRNAHTLIIDGEICENEAETAGYNGIKIADICREANAEIKDIFLLTADDFGSINIIMKEKK
jgi:uncharacterized membrane protein YcaP (DUF421 family)